MKAIMLSVAALAMFAGSAGQAVADDDNRYRVRPLPGYQFPMQGRINFYIGPRGEVYLDGSADPFGGYYGQPQYPPPPPIPHSFNAPGYYSYPYRQPYPRYGRPYYYDDYWQPGYKKYRKYDRDDDDDDDD